MVERNTDPDFDADEIEAQDPLGEQMFAEQGFEDAPGGGPALDTDDPDGEIDRRPSRGGQKVAGVPEKEQRIVNTPSNQRPDTEGAVIRERGGESKGDPAVGGTRPT